MEKDKTAQSFSKLLKAFSSDEDEAVSFYTYLYESLVRFFRMKGDSLPEEAADVTIDRLSSKISQNEPIENLVKYSYGVARLVFLERLRRQQKEKNAAEAFYSQNGFYDDDEQDPNEQFRACFEQLSDEEKKLLKEYFADLPASELSRHREKISAEMGISLNRLRLNIFRLRGKLENCLKKNRKKNKKL